MGFFHKKNECSYPEYEQILEEKSYDWLSDLPTDILHHILSFLDFTEVVKTASLSRKWRFIYRSVPCLNFSFKDFRDQEHYLAKSYDECRSEFWVFVKWTFTMKASTPIYRLQFLCDYFDGFQLELLLSLCAMNNVHELELMVGYGVNQCPMNCRVIKHVEAFTDNIYSMVKLQSFAVFGTLKTLHLVRVKFPDNCITEKLFNDCGVLENLSLEHCCFLMTKFLNICANKLRKLNFVNMSLEWWGCKCIFEGELKLHTPNLVSLCYEGPVVQLRVFSDMLFLKRASIMVYCHPIVLSRELAAMGLGIHHVEELSVSADFVLNWISNWKSREMDEGFLSHNLKEVKIVVYGDSAESLELIKFFLENGKVLKRIKFTQRYKKVNPEIFYALHEVRLASKEVTVSVASITATGRSDFEFIYGKCGVSVQTSISKMKIKIRRSLRIAGKKSDSSS